MTFTILIPAYREYDNLRFNVPHLVERFGDRAEILVVENGSDIAPDLDYLAVRTISMPHKGLGGALKLGLESARHDCVVFLPADMSYDLAFVDVAVPLIEHASIFDLIIGSKGLRESRVGRPYSRKAVSGLYNWWHNTVFKQLRVRDITGVKAYRRSRIRPLLESCPSDGILFEVQLIIQMRKRGMGILEVPVVVRDYHPSRFVPWQVPR